MVRILIAAENSGFFPVSIRDGLTRLNYGATLVPLEVEAIGGQKQLLSGILIYAENAVEDLHQQSALHMLRERAFMNDIPVFLAGERAALDSIKTVISTASVVKEFIRPIFVNELVDSVDSYMKNMQVKKKILLVDDNGLYLRNAKEWLSGKYNVTLAHSAATAIKQLGINRPDLVLLDYDMPVVDGKKVLEMIRTEAEFEDIPVIFLTAVYDEKSVTEVVRLRVEGYLLKTLEPKAIVSAIDGFFDRLKAQQF
jgi:CheY-like chemotaxis protein